MYYNGIAVDSKIRVLTYNIHKGFSSGNRRFMLDSMRQRIAETHADIVFLQEIHGKLPYRKKIHIKQPSSELPQFEYLADQSWPHFAYGQNAIYKKGNHGNAILSKYPFSSWENVDISIFPRSSRSILHGVIDIPGQRAPLHTLCVHMGLLERERREQLRALTKRIDSHVPHNEPLIIAGDFNDWRRRAEKHLRQDLDLEELFVTLQGRHARTFPIWAPVLSVDRIYYRRMSPVSCQCLKTGHWRELSDHAALLGDLQF